HATLADARVGNPLLQRLPDATFTHYVEIDLPADEVLLTYLTEPVYVDGTRTENFLSLAVHVPREIRRASAARGYALRRAAAGKPHPKLARLFRHEDPASIAQAFAHIRAGDLDADFLADLTTPFDTAATLLMQHPGLVNLGAASGAPATVQRDCVMRALHWRSRLVDVIEDRPRTWSKRVPLLDDGKPVVDDEGPVFSVELHEVVESRIADPLMAALRYANQLEELENQTWRVHYGSTTDEHDALAAAQTPSPQTCGVRWTLQALSRMNGLRTNRNVVFDPPREGGWSIHETWSIDDTPPLTADIVAALSGGRVFARVDTTVRSGVWVGTFPAQTLRDEYPAHFDAVRDNDVAGADYATVALTVDALRHDLTVDLALTAEASTEALASVNIGVRAPDGTERIVWSAQPSTQGLYGNLRIRVANEWLRYLGTYVEFYDAHGRPIVPPGWTSRIPFVDVREMFDRHPTKRYLGVLSPIGTIFGVPLPPLTETLNIPVPESAASLQLFWGGLGTGFFDETVCAAGITCTSVMNLAIPIILLLAGSSEQDSGLLNNLMRDQRVRYGVYAAGAALLGGSGGYIGQAQDPARAARSVALALGPILVRKGAQKLAIYLARKAGEGFARRSIPFINIAFAVFDKAVNLAQLGQTIAAAVQSPFYYATRLTRTFDLRVTILPDEQFNTFPDLADRLRVQVMYDTGNSLPLSETHLPPRPRPRSLPAHFDNIAAGGRVRVFVFFYTHDGWQAAAGSTAWMDARGRGDSSVLDVSLNVKNALVPLSRNSVYRHENALAYEGNRYLWKKRPAPTTTIGDATALSGLVGITIAQQPTQLAYAWRSSDLNLPRDRPGSPTGETMYAMQTLSFSDDTHARRALTPFGFTRQCGVAYDLGSPADGTGANFYLDPSRGTFDVDTNLAGGVHLRRIALSLAGTPRFEPGSNRSWGRFPTEIDSFVVHPQGYVAAVSASQSKLYILELPTAPSDDASARMASLYSGESADRDNDDDDEVVARIGLMGQPRAIAVALDGRLLVLEDGNQRIQSFDLSGNPVPYFRQEGSDERTPVLPLRDTGASATTYVDLSVEARGYLFVLARDGAGT
ncbi:MAG TPA: hypothetical protein VJ724_08395, partial [Tahibacter sp.]|nr:hypothetical protein [Tahibacter sp.]